MAAGNDNDRYVQKRPDGKWEVVKGTHERASAVTARQSDAITRAGTIVGNAGGGEVVIKNEQNKIRAKNTIKPGNDPRSSKG